MKKYISLLLVITALVLCACGSSSASQASPSPSVSPAQESSAVTTSSVTTLELYNKIVTVTDESDSDVPLCEVKYPAVSLGSSDAEKYPALARSLASLNADGAQNSNAAYPQLLSAAQSEMERRSASAAAIEASGLESEDEEQAFETFYRYDDLTLPRADSRAVSILYSMTSFSGGVHGNYYYYSVNLDSSTGRKLSVSDVVTDMAQLRSVLDDGIRAANPDADLSPMEDALNEYFLAPDSFTWTLDYQGLTFYFSPGELSDLEYGRIIYSIRFDDYDGLFSLYYTETPNTYVVPFTGGEVLNYDLNRDGVADSISVEFEYDDDGEGIEKLIIDVNGKSYTASTPMQDCRMYMVYAGGAKHFLFISAQNLTGYGYISVYKIDRTGATLVGMQYERSLYAAEYCDVCPGTALLTNPDSFVMGTRIQYLGTLTGLKTYSIGEDGMPVSEDSYYTLYGGDPLTLKSQLITATIDSSTGSGTMSAATLNPGTVLRFLRSDGEGSVDMYTDDGIYCRLYVSGKPGSQKVNGMDVDSVFSGISY